MSKRKKSWTPTLEERKQQADAAKFKLFKGAKEELDKFDKFRYEPDGVYKFDVDPGKFTPMQGGGYIAMDETGHWDLDMLKKVMDLNPGIFKQEYDAPFKEKKTNPIGEWCDKWVKNERAKREV